MRNMRRMGSMSVVALMMVGVLAVASYGCDSAREERAEEAAEDAATTDTYNTTTPDTNMSGADTATTDTGRTMGAVVDDQTIQTKLKAALLADTRVPGTKIDTQVVNGVATLTGIVDNDAQKAAAEEVARGIEGVTEVRNELTVGAQ
jgi:hyperosmotically inducible protein